jgi:AcrR family transcriptional regulator
MSIQRKRKSIGEIRRDELTSAAIECIIRKGFDRMTLEEVAKESGSSQGNVLYYFKNREALMRAAAERIGDDMLEKTLMIWGIPADVKDEKKVHQLIRERCSEQNIDFIAVIREGVKIFINWFKENPHVIATGLELFLQVRRHSIIEEVRDKVNPFIRNACVVFIEEGIRPGAFKKRDPQYTALMLISLLAGISFALVTTRQGEFDATIIERELCDLIFGFLQY